MVVFLSFVTLAFGSMVVASSLESKMESNLQKRTTINCADSGESAFLTTALNEVQALSATALVRIKPNSTADGAADELFIKYFGHVQDTTPQSYIFINVGFANPTLNCADPAGNCAQGDVSYILDDGPQNVVLCPSFFNEVPISSLCSGTSADSGTIRGGTMHSILSIVLGQTHDTAEGCSNARNLAVTNPDDARMNVDNYSCFAMEAFAQAHCVAP